MKPELTHLLQKLKAAHPDFHSLIIHPNGASLAIRNHGSAIPFANLAALESYAWPGEVGTAEVGTAVPSGPSGDLQSPICNDQSSISSPLCPPRLILNPPLP